MKDLGYVILKFWVKTSLHLYYGKIQVNGLERVPKDKPVLFLPNHQSALMDVLLLAVDCGRKPYFLTRSDVFKKPKLRRFFNYLQMIPIYRIRDGRASLKNNDAVFARCAEILSANEALLLFPEANHNVKRSVRTLSKGFTRILFGALDADPDIDVQIIPVGMNYRSNTGFPDRVAVNFGECIPARAMYKKSHVLKSTRLVKEVVADRLKTLTTHIDGEVDYEEMEARLNAQGVDYLQPERTNESIRRLKNTAQRPSSKTDANGITVSLTPLFMLANFLPVLVWRGWVKPKVWEPEFMGTFRFGFAMLAMPIYYLLVWGLMAFFFDFPIAFVVVTALFAFNFIYVRLF